jgi:ligand-binding sensor domain-containing protein/signal transduction histidine kinase
MSGRLTIFLVSLLPFTSLAQVKPFSFRNISIDQGLSQSSVVDIAIDRTGFVWMATQDGLNRFDGKDFITFTGNFDDITTPASNQLGKITLGENNKLWLITRGGKLEKMDLFTQAASVYKKLKDQSLPAANCVYQDSAYLFIGTRNEGLWIYQQQHTQLLHLTQEGQNRISSNEIREVFKDSRNQYWILTPNGINCFSSTLNPTSLFLANKEQPVRSSAIAEDSQQTIWLGTFGNGLFIKNKNIDSFQHFTGFANAALPANLVIETLLADNEGRIWVGTFSDGLYVIDNKTSLIHHLLSDKKDPFSLAYNDVLCIRQDKRGGIWIGTDGGGVSYYDQRLSSFETFSGNNLPENISIEQVRAITTDKENNTWVGTSINGLTLLGKQPVTIGNYKKIGALLTDRDGDIWVGTQENGLNILDGRTRQVIKKWLPGQTIWSMLQDAGGKVWVATRQQGLYQMDKRSGELNHFDEQSNPALAENNVRAMAFTKDSMLYIGFEKSGIQLLNIRNKQLMPVPKNSSFIFNGSVLIRSMYYTPSVLWIGTFGSGLIAMETASGKITAITEKQGLRNNTIYGIQPDGLGSIWLSTNKGLCRLRLPESPERISRADMFAFTLEDGLQSNEFNTGAHYRSPGGHLFFGGINGLTTFDPSRLSRIEQPSAVVITQVLADNQPLHTDTLITYKKILQLPYSQNSLSFSFAALDVLSAGRLNYSYQLSGYDKGWMEAGNRNFAAYTHLPSGEYLFRVKASRNFSSENAPVTSLLIIIRPPFWKTAWFIGLIVLLLAAALYGIYRYRISQLIRLQKVRNRIASDLHDDIGSALTHISILSELSKNGVLPSTETALFLDRISEEVASSGQALDDIVWSINSNNDTMEQMVARMRRYAAEILDTKVEKYVVDFDDRFAHRKLSMEQRRDIFLLFKEVISNIYKHSRATVVEIRIWFEKSNLHMQVKDDGVGFDKSKATERNGIKNMQARTEKWNGQFLIRSEPGKGTETNISMPLA